MKSLKAATALAWGRLLAFSLLEKLAAETRSIKSGHSNPWTCLRAASLIHVSATEGGSFCTRENRASTKNFLKLSRGSASIVCSDHRRRQLLRARGPSHRWTPRYATRATSGARRREQCRLKGMQVRDRLPRRPLLRSAATPLPKRRLFLPRLAPTTSKRSSPGRRTARSKPRSCRAAPRKKSSSSKPILSARAARLPKTKVLRPWL